MPELNLDIKFPPKFEALFKDYRYAIWYGGRGAGKSWQVCRALLLMGCQQSLRILCCREIMVSIADSVHQLLVDQIHLLKLGDFYTVERDKIYAPNGTVFRFAGIRRDITQIKSFEGIDICFVEEAANVSHRSWEVLIPTVRKTGSRFIIIFNPEYATDATYQRFVVNPPPNAFVCKVNHDENPHFPEELRLEMEDLKERDYDAYRHIYLGECRSYITGAVYADQIRQAEQEGRFTKLIRDPNAPLECAWDLGIADNCGIWVAQRVHHELHILKYVQDHGKPLDWYLNLLNMWCEGVGATIEVHHLPHDARARELGTGLSREEVLRSRGKTVRIVPRLSVEDGIAAVRHAWPFLWFDPIGCGEGLAGLRQYKYEKLSDTVPNYRQKPEHTWASHCADALRYLVIGMRPPKLKIAAETSQQTRKTWGQAHNQGWMSF